jgi:hypothetical protein
VKNIYYKVYISLGNVTAYVHKGGLGLSIQFSNANYASHPVNEDIRAGDHSEGGHRKWGAGAKRNGAGGGEVHRRRVTGRREEEKEGGER